MDVSCNILFRSRRRQLFIESNFKFNTGALASNEFNELILSNDFPDESEFAGFYLFFNFIPEKT